jgi:hypothetical protein
MNIKYLKELVDDAEKIDPQNEVLAEENSQKRLNEMSKNLDDTINYLDTCSDLELFWATEVLEELSARFKSKKLIECVERNITRCTNDEVKSQLLMTLGYMKQHI